MTLKVDAKFPPKKLICCFKNDKDLVSFDLSTGNSQNVHFYCSFCAKYLTLDLSSDT